MPKQVLELVDNLNKWFEWHNSQLGVQQSPEEFLMLNCGSVINKWLQAYIAKTRLTKTLYFLIWHFMTVQNPHYLKFLEKKSIVFMDFFAAWTAYSKCA